MTSSNPLTDRLGIQPIIQAPMAGVATPELAAAVSNAGGLGSLGIGASSVEQARSMIERTRALTSRPFNVNVFCHTPAVRDAARESAWLAHLAPLFRESGGEPPSGLEEIYRSFLEDEAAFEMLLETRPAVVSFHFGLPSEARIRALREAGIYTLATATNLPEAREIQTRGLDAIVAQGYEAGGHRGCFDPQADDERLSTAVLVRRLVREMALPIVAAGGIMDGQGIRAALALGACAAQLGTAFILCPESAANDGYRSNLKSERAEVTRMTSALSGRPARGILNRLIRHADATPGAMPPAYPVAYDAAKRLNAAAAGLGHHEFAAHWAGQGAPLARELPAGELVSRLLQEWQDDA
ncbi:MULTISPECIES: nitronate monooxygenase [unclassified Modicisalibacter]|uniref:NAD(P)H-dependent flavin oxidoreductase n=1 Tax=unclassified Modicisalibacter TaxID=2679913 RepID=UPI001DE3A393|nr:MULTISPECIES: nitronate monooxygenase [unclassified Modicisalibacter]MBZ9559689.1 nitronate monooxygenase [Modicisalibacter sp. R2A 31.J]MBZ9577141.1 nitronate monooxygenase [Modicisalibacter sp. MOD 31.J]